MATITLNVPNDLLRRARLRLGGNGASDVKEYLAMIVRVEKQMRA